MDQREEEEISQQGLSDCLFSIQSNSDTNHELALIDQLAIYASGMKSRPLCISLSLSETIKGGKIRNTRVAAKEKQKDGDDDDDDYTGDEKGGGAAEQCRTI